MPGQHIGYARVSTINQQASRQLEGIQVDRVFTDYTSGKNRCRPQLEAMLNYARDGDTITVHSIDRLARNLPDLRQIVSDLTQRGITIRFLKEGLTFGHIDSPIATLMLSMLGAFAEFERTMIRERQREGIAIAKQAGKYRGSQPVLTIEKATELRELAAIGLPKTQLAKKFGISRATVYNYL